MWTGMSQGGPGRRSPELSQYGQPRLALSTWEPVAKNRDVYNVYKPWCSKHTHTHIYIYIHIIYVCISAYYIVSYFIVSYPIIFWFMVLYVLLHYVLVHYVRLYCIMFCYIIFECIIFCFTLYCMLLRCNSVLLYFVMSYVMMLCNIVIYCIILYNVVLLHRIDMDWSSVYPWLVGSSVHRQGFKDFWAFATSQPAEGQMGQTWTDGPFGSLWVTRDARIFLDQSMRVWCASPIKRYSIQMWYIVHIYIYKKEFLDM